MSSKVMVVGTFDQPVDELYEVDLMRMLKAVGLPVSGVVFRRSTADRNPETPVAVDPLGDGRYSLHVQDFNAPATVERIRELTPDLLVYAGGRDILREGLLGVARLGCIGGHYGRLPEIRGMATVEWSVMLGVDPTVAIQQIDVGIDTGTVLLQARVPLVLQDTFVSIRDRSYLMTKAMLALAARRLIDGSAAGLPQSRDSGRQYYRLHPVLQARADRMLRARLDSLQA